MASPPFQIVLGDGSDISKFITSHFLWEIIFKEVKEEFGSLKFLHCFDQGGPPEGRARHCLANCPIC